MKFLKAIFVVVFLFISSTALAFESPDPNRWDWIHSDDEKGMWLDRATIQYTDSYDGPRATFWYRVYYPAKNTMDQFRVEAKLTQMEIKPLYVLHYVDEKVEHQQNIHGDFMPVPPDSVGENLLFRVKSLKR